MLQTETSTTRIKTRATSSSSLARRETTTTPVEKLFSDKESIKQSSIEETTFLVHRGVKEKNPDFNSSNQNLPNQSSKSSNFSTNDFPHATNSIESFVINRFPSSSPSASDCSSLASSCDPSSSFHSRVHSSSSSISNNQRVALMSGTQQSSVVQPLLTDLYQISMAYAYWKSGKHQEMATFDVYFRKNPFGIEYTLFAGLEECLKFIRDYRFHSTDIDYLRQTLPPYIEETFFEFLSQMNMNDIKVNAVPEGSVVFPRIPLMRIEGPVLKAQLLETTLLALVNYASLVATNAARFRSATGADKTLLEFGLRRAQGPDGGLSASKYCYLGGFDGTSNVLAGKLYGIPVRGTHAHAYVNSYESMEELTERELCDRISGERRPFADLCLQYLKELGPILKFLPEETHKGELAAFVSYAIAFPTNFLALVDTYDVLKSGLPNFLAVARALHECNYQAVGLRLDSGDLAYLSLEVRAMFHETAKKFQLPYFEHLNIVASNDINEDTLVSLEKQGHSIDTFGIGTHLVTCQRQPALGCVYKLVELSGSPRMKVSQDNEKVSIPGRKNLYRLFGHDGKALCDLLTRSDEDAPQQSVRMLSRHPFVEQKRAYVTPTSVQSLYRVYWSDGEIRQPLPTLKEIRTYAREQLGQLRRDHVRELNPTPYKVSVTNDLFQFMHKLWMRSVPIGELD